MGRPEFLTGRHPTPRCSHWTAPIRNEGRARTWVGASRCSPPAHFMAQPTAERAARGKRRQRALPEEGRAQPGAGRIVQMLSGERCLAAIGPARVVREITHPTGSRTQGPGNMQRTCCIFTDNGAQNAHPTGRWFKWTVPVRNEGRARTWVGASRCSPPAHFMAQPTAERAARGKRRQRALPGEGRARPGAGRTVQMLSGEWSLAAIGPARVVREITHPTGLGNKSDELTDIPRLFRA